MTRPGNGWPQLARVLPQARSWKRDRAEIVVQAGCATGLFFALLVICLRPETPGWAGYLMGCFITANMTLVARRIALLRKYRRQRQALAGDLCHEPVQVYLQFGSDPGKPDD